MEDEGLEDGAYNALYDRVDALEEEARDLQEAYSAEDLARSGVIASWQGGQITLHVGLVRQEDTVKEEGARGSSASPTGEEAPDAGEISYPASLAEDLKTERAMALGAAMALHPEATLDLTLFKLVSDVLGTGMSVTQAIKIDARKEYRNHAKMDEIDETSLEQVAAAHDALDLSWLDDTASRKPAASCACRKRRSRARSCSAPQRARPVRCWRSISRGEIRSCAGRFIELPGNSRSCGLS